MKLLARLRGVLRRGSAEGEVRPGPHRISDGWLLPGSAMNWWQMGKSPASFGEGGAMVEACVSAYAQTIAMCPGDHWRKRADGGRERVTTSALSRIMKRPNDYQSISDLLLNLTHRLYGKGEAFALAVRNNRFEPSELHLMRHGYPLIAGDGSIFYQLGGNEIAERRFDLSHPIPARDVMHVRLHTPWHPLKGEGPIVATVLERAMAGAALNQQIAYYLNQARPSWLLETDAQLNAVQVKELRERWEEQTTGENAGRTPILTNGLKAKAAPTTAQDGQLAEMLKLTDQNIALAFRIPLQVLGIGGTPFASTEALVAAWKASGLGFALNHIEEAFGLFFGLAGQPDEYLELDTEALMRSAFKDRIEALGRAVITGIYSHDEARNKEDLPAVEGGHGKMPRVQQQVVPLSYGSAVKPPSEPVAAPVPAESDEIDPADDDERFHSAIAIEQRLHGYASSLH